MTTTIDASGNLHDDAGRFSGHLQAEADTTVLPAPDAQPLLDADQTKYLYDASGMFYLGPDEAGINDLAANLAGAVEIRCVWEYTDHQGMKGEETIIGRVPGGSWRPISEELDTYLRHGEEDTEVPARLLADEPYEPEYDLDDAMFINGANVTNEKRMGLGGYLW